MTETVLLTDDELVALCAIDGRPWPFGLITVEPTAVEVAKAGMRGMRSLMVRRYAGESSGGTPKVDETIARYVTAFLDTGSRVGAYVAPASDPATLGGASVTAVKSTDGWLLDTATAAGVHALRAASAEDALAAVLAIVEKAESQELFDGEEDLSRWVCVASVDAGQHVVAGDGAAVTLVRDALLHGDREICPPADRVSARG